MPVQSCEQPRPPPDFPLMTRLHDSIVALEDVTQERRGLRRLVACGEVLADLGVERPEWWKAKAFDGAAELLRRQGVTQRFTVD